MLSDVLGSDPDSVSVGVEEENECDLLLEAVVAAVAGMGVAGEIAATRMQPVDGNASLRTYIIDALFNMNARALEAVARIEEV